MPPAFYCRGTSSEDDVPSHYSNSCGHILKFDVVENEGSAQSGGGLAIAYEDGGIDHVRVNDGNSTDGLIRSRWSVHADWFQIECVKP